MRVRLSRSAGGAGFAVNGKLFGCDAVLQKNTENMILAMSFFCAKAIV
jgi:hypothetical protein